MSLSSQRLATSLCSLVLIGLVLGTAGQSAVLFLATALAVLTTLRRAPQHLTWKLWAPGREERLALICFFGFVAWNVVATLLNPKNPYRGFSSFLVTHASVMLVPPLWALCWRRQGRDRAFWSRLSLGLLAVWALVALSQALIGWQMEGSQLVFHPHYQRARGFYSHPLTFAYVLLVIWPFFLVELVKNPRSRSAWLKVFCLGLMFVLSASRTAQIAVFLSLLWAFTRLLQGSQRRFAIGLLALLVLTVALTENPASRRFKRLFDHKDPDRFSSYADDRLAFWHAFAGMLRERPILGHGIHLDKEYRTPYYEAIGLGDFKKKYEAHNQLIQILAEGGLIGLTLFLLWFIFLVRSLSQNYEVDRHVLFLTVLIFFFAGLTQNSYQDFEVRYALILMLSLAFACARRPQLEEG